MKNLLRAGTGNSDTGISKALCLRAWLLLITTAMLVACGGSSGGDDDGTGPVDPVPQPSDAYLVSGTVAGLSGPVRISDGFQTLDVSNDGPIAFTHEYKKGDTFAVTVDTGATEQLCTLTHGSGLVLNDIDDVAIDCLAIREINVRISKPSYYTAYSQLGLRSSYQSIDQLAGETATLVVARNQFITLSTSAAQSRPVYAAFVKSFDELNINELSTAVSLVLLSPSIHGAIEERGARFELYADRVAALPAVTALAAAIKVSADAGRLNLQSPTADLLTLLDSAVMAAANDIAIEAIPTSLKVSARERTSQKLNLTPENGTQDGIAMVLQQIATDASGNNYQLQISNTQQRFVAVESPLLPEPIALPPGGSNLQLLNSADVSDVQWVVHGPGAQAAAAPASTLLKQAVIDTAYQFYAVPSLAFASGQLNAFDWRVLACIDVATLQQLREQGNAALLADATLASALQTPNYTAAYDAVAAPLRADVISNLEGLMQCEYFRKGHWLDEHADTAVLQIGMMLNIAQAHYAPRVAAANVLVTPGLLSVGNVINTSMTMQQWQLSNQLAISLTQTRNGTTSPVDGTVTINEGETLVLGASCTDPASAAPVACSLQWTSAQGTSASNSFSAVMTVSGTISVAATDEDGASASRQIAITVVPSPPQSVSYWIQQDGESSNRVDINAVEVVVEDINDEEPADNVTQIRGYASATSASPMINLSLPQFAGAGSYVLDNLASGRECLGATLVQQGQSAQLWCTKTAGQFEVSPATGTVVYSIDSQGKRTVDFDFHVVPAECVIPDTCAQQRQHINGHIELP